ncbi:hypothetical protein CSOJ01_10004 [Colletotrichum sojae]|uniref:Uncharacterized protein n=1 Tax=Colletotrichum sojae TaxID=2175907 RepID=A0A8H6J1J2_9PEZI|nr:hypothetical protein CSOJ01_10004 [Colletotrichum sojae]
MAKPERFRRSHEASSSQRDWEKGSDSDVDDDLPVHFQTAETSESSKSLLNTYNPASKPSSRRYLLLAVILSAILGALTSLGITTLISHLRTASAAHRNDNTLASPSLSQSTTFLQVSPCGGTPSEARAAGCAFDLVSFNWLPPACHDAQLAADFEKELEAAGMLAWYEDPQRARPLSREQVATGERSGVYVSLGYHLRHCTAMWRRMHRAIMQGGGGLGRVDGYIWGYHHTRHCEEMLLGRYNESEIGEVFTTEVRIKYPDCGVVL